MSMPSNSQLIPISKMRQDNGVKCLIYGGPGVGKTPLGLTAPKPVILVTETGTLSVGNSQIPAWPAFTLQAIEEFFMWANGSREFAQFDSLVIDSFSNLCEIIIAHLLRGKSKSGNQVNGLKAYGELETRAMELVFWLLGLPRKHVFIMCKCRLNNFGHGSTNNLLLPGQQLPVKVPGEFDVIGDLGRFLIPNAGEQRAIRFAPQAGECFPRDRSGKLSEYEPPDLKHIVQKIYS